MKCFSCKEELEDDSKFCKHCGQVQKVDTAEQELTPMESLTEKIKSKEVDLMNEKSQKSGGGKKLLLGGVALVAVVAGGALAFSETSSTVKVGVAVNNTIERYTDVSENIYEQLPFYEHLEDFVDSAYKMNVSVSDGTTSDEVVVYSDLENNAIRMDYNLDGDNIDFLWANDHMIVTTSLLDTNYGINLSTLASDLQNCEFLDFEVPVGFDFGLFKLSELKKLKEFDDICTDILMKSMLDLAKEVEIEKLDKEVITIAGQEKKADRYSIKIDPVALEKGLINLMEDFFANEFIAEYMESIFVGVGMAEYIDYGDVNSDTMDIFINEIKEIYLDGVDDIIFGYTEFYESMDEANHRTIINIYDNEVVQLRITGDYLVDSGDIVFSLNMDNNNIEIRCYQEPFENMEGFEIMKIHCGISNGLFNLSMDEYERNSMTYSYDTKGSVNNMKVFEDGYEILSMTITSPNKGILYGSVDIDDSMTLEVVSEKAGLPSAKLASVDYTNILDLSENELIKIGIEIAMKFMTF